MSEPTTLRAGDSAAWSRSLPDYPPAAGWALKYRLIWPAGTPVDITAGHDGTDYTVSLGAEATQDYPAGAATLVARVERGSGPTLERVTLGQQAITILPDLAAATTLDGRSAAARALADAKSALTVYLAGGIGHVLETDIGGRRTKFRGVKEITDLIEYLQRQVSAENLMAAAMDGRAPGRVLVRM